MTTSKYVLSAFMLERDTIEMIRLYAFEKRMKKSEVVREALKVYFSKNKLEKGTH